MTVERREDDIAEALADFQGRRSRGEDADVLAYRDRLGESHVDFLALADTDALLDDLIEPPPAEVLPREFGPYTLLRELGRGAIGVVYEAVHRTLRRRAAVKVLRHGFDTDPQARERFRREAAACAQVRHDHVVEIYEASEVEGRPFFAMALVEGRSLASLVKAREVPDPRALCRGLADVADALETLHRAGVVHRDVKPSNIMVRPDGRMVLADFGLARAADGLALTRTGDALGTPLYMSPEQMLGQREEVDARVDVYALGATLYEAVAGRPAFVAPDLASLARRVVAERPEALRKAAPACPASIEHIAMKALEKRKEDRYASAAALRDDLLRSAGGRDREVVGRPVGGVVRTLRAARERWVPLAAGFVVAAAGAWFWTHREGTLELHTVPDGVEVIVAGEVKGRTPATLGLAPGTYDVVLRTEGFVDRTYRAEVAAGGTGFVELPLLPKDPADPVARLRLARGLEVGALGYASSTTRGTGDDLAVFRWPRGDVRLADLDEVAFELGPRVPDAPTLEFRRGTAVLGRLALPTDRPSGSVPVPAEVRSALAVGDEVVVTLDLPKAALRGGRKAPQVTFRVVADAPAAEALARVDRLLAGADPTVHAEMAVRALLQAGLTTAAARAADRGADAAPTNLPAQALALAIYKQMRLGESLRAQELVLRIQGFPQAERDRLAPEAPATK